MPHSTLVEHSTKTAAAVGDAYAQVTKLRAAGLGAAHMIILGTLEGALARIAEGSVAMGEVAHGLDEPTVDEKAADPAPAPIGEVKTADSGPTSKTLKTGV